MPHDQDVAPGKVLSSRRFYERDTHVHKNVGTIDLSLEPHLDDALISVTTIGRRNKLGEQVDGHTVDNGVKDHRSTTKGSNTRQTINATDKSFRIGCTVDAVQCQTT